jgi:AbrB family looped-hinge helix DNA binding protein
MERQAVKIGPGGRIVIPANMREKLGVKPGDSLIVTEADGEIRMATVESGIRKVQALIAQYVPPDVSLVDELIAERRAEAARE